MRTRESLFSIFFILLCFYAKGTNVIQLDSTVSERYLQGTWGASSVVYHTYTANGWISESEVWYINPGNGDRRPQYLYHYDYASANDSNWSMMTESSWNQSSNQWQWMQQDKQTFANGNLIVYESSSFNKSDSTWKPVRKNEYTYSNNTLESGLGKTWYNGSWEDNSGFLINFDANGHVISKEYKNYSNGVPVNAALDSFFRDADGHDTLRLHYSWSSGLNRYNLYNVFKSSYNQRGDLIQQSQFDFDNVNQEWTETKRNEFAVDIQKDLRALAYDPKYYEDYDGFSPLKKKTYSLLMNGIMTPNIRLVFYYSAFPESLPTIGELSGVEMYPNPCKSLFNISVPGNREILTLTVYSVEGRKMPIVWDRIKNKVEVPELARGIYFVRIEYQNGIREVRKIQKME
ncbi:MAG: T9SS type A sorting domain-containing protein [Bacteroidetes bacterium]|nr:T9SS type A sorting domain-containing protein [Bacteroidota bacterium]